MAESPPQMPSYTEQELTPKKFLGVDGEWKEFYLDERYRYIRKEKLAVDDIFTEAVWSRAELLYLRFGLQGVELWVVYDIVSDPEGEDKYVLEGPRKMLGNVGKNDGDNIGEVLSREGGFSSITTLASTIANIRFNELEGRLSILPRCDSNLMGAAFNALSGSIVDRVISGNGNCLDHMAFLKLFAEFYYPEVDNPTILRYKGADFGPRHYGLQYLDNKDKTMITNYSGITVSLDLLNLVFAYRHRSKTINDSYSEETNFKSKLEEYAPGISQYLTDDSMTLTKAFKIYVTEVLKFRGTEEEKQEVGEVITSQFRALRIAAMK